MSIVIAGFLLGLSLIIAIGPQNALIIRQGIKRQAIVAVLVVCMLSDAILISAGTAGVGVLINHAPIALTILKWLGVAYLAWFGYSCFKDAFAPNNQALVVSEEPDSVTHTEQSLSNLGSTHGMIATKTQPTTATKTMVSESPSTTTWIKPVLAALAFTWLNPAAYVDTLVMLGGMANQHGETGRWLFCFGAVLASLTWFPLLGFGAARFSHVLSQPKAWQVINFAIGCIMIIMCLRLIMH